MLYVINDNDDNKNSINSNINNIYEVLRRTSLSFFK